MLWRRRKAEPLGAPRTVGIINRLHVNAMVIEEIVAGLFTKNRVSDEDRNDVRDRRHYRDTALR